MPGTPKRLSATQRPETAEPREPAGSWPVGWVKNLPDGRVEMIAMSHDPDELEAFLSELQENSGVSHGIKETETHSVPPPPGVTGFSIVR